MNDSQNKSSTFSKRFIDSYKNDKISFIFILLLIVLGIFFRVYQYGIEGGIETDSPGAIAGGIKWYYPHDYFPGLMHTYPPFGGMVIGAGCMLSGADFSPIIQQPRNFYPSIAYLIGEPFASAEKYCLSSSYAASILLLIGLTILSFSLLEKYSAIYATAFFAFFGIIIQWGRLIYYDIILWMITIYGILFLWWGYREEKGVKKESNMFLMAAALFGLATATKYTAGIFILFEMFIIFEKYSFEVLKNISNFKDINLKNQTS